MFVLLTDSINNKAVPAVVIVMNSEQCAVQHYSVCLCSILWSVV